MREGKGGGEREGEKNENPFFLSFSFFDTVFVECIYLYAARALMRFCCVFVYLVSSSFSRDTSVVC